MESFDGAATAAVNNSDSNVAVILIAIVAVLFVAVRWGFPLVKELRVKKLEIERYRIEVDEKAATALDDRERERIKTTQRQIAVQEASTRAIEALTSQVAASNVQLIDSKEKSSQMSEAVMDIRGTTMRTARQVDEMHDVIVRGGRRC